MKGPRLLAGEKTKGGRETVEGESERASGREALTCVEGNDAEFQRARTSVPKLCLICARTKVRARCKSASALRHAHTSARQTTYAYTRHISTHHPTT